MNKTLPLLALVALGATGTVARAEVSSTITLASDYDFRGITQSALDPALQASLDWSAESGLYASLWASNVDFGEDTTSDTEVDLVLGYSGSVNDDFGYDLGVARYNYFDNGDDIDYNELFAGFTFKMFSAKLWYADDYVNSGESGSYLEGNLDVPLPNDFTFNLHIGRSAGDYWDSANDGGYTDYSVGVTRAFGNFELGLKWLKTSGYEFDKDVDANSGDRRALLTISTTVPW